VQGCQAEIRNSPSARRSLAAVSPGIFHHNENNIGHEKNSSDCADSSDSLSGNATAQSFDAERKIDSLLSMMTLPEKLGQLNQIGGTWYDTKTDRISKEQADMLRRGEIGSFLGVVGAEETGRIQRIAVKESRLGDSRTVWFGRYPWLPDDVSYSSGRSRYMESGTGRADGTHGGAGSICIRRLLDVRANGGHCTRSALGTDCRRIG